jgi:hypothetical protein
MLEGYCPNFCILIIAGYHPYITLHYITTFTAPPSHRKPNVRYPQIHCKNLLTKVTDKIQLCRIIYCSLTALHVSSDIFVHHQEHHNCIYSFWYYSRMWLPAGLQPATTYVNNTRSCKYSCNAPDDERKYHSKHVELSRNNKLSYTVASCWSFP